MRGILSKGRSKKGIFEGDLIEGELEIGQVSAQLDAVKSAAIIVNELMEAFNLARKNIQA